MKKILLTIIGIATLSGCTDLDSDKVAYVEGKEEIDFIIEKDYYACGEEDFFFVEKGSSRNVVNFIYGNYSTSLSEKPSISDRLYSDGIYKLTFKGEEVDVAIGQEVILKDCKKT